MRPCCNRITWATITGMPVTPGMSACFCGGGCGGRGRGVGVGGLGVGGLGIGGRGLGAGGPLRVGGCGW
jgi:hypothetical protein